MTDIPLSLQRQFANHAIRQYVVCSHLYYKHEISHITDAEYDQLCRWLCDNFDWIKPHDVNGYLDINSLLCGTGYHLNLGGQHLKEAEAIVRMGADVDTVLAEFGLKRIGVK